VDEAPSPDDVLWANLTAHGPKKWTKNLIVLGIFIGITFFWGIPVGYIVQFSNLYTLTQVEGGEVEEGGREREGRSGKRGGKQGGKKGGREEEGREGGGRKREIKTLISVSEEIFPSFLI
jgi:hypothetical protein